MSGLPSPSQSAAVAIPPPLPPDTEVEPAGRIIGDFARFVFGPRTFVKMLIWKRVGFRPPLPSEPRNCVNAAGTTTSMRVLVALRGRARTLFPSVAREK